MAGPWEKYQTAPQEPEAPKQKPWERFAGQKAAEAGEAVKDAVLSAGQPPEATFDGYLANAFHDMTLGYGDEIVAAGRDFFGIQDYDEALRQHRGIREETAEADPVGSFAAGLAGGILVPGVGFAKAAQAPTLIGKGLGLAGVGAATGGLMGFGMGEGGFDNRLERAGWGAGIGAVATPAITGLLSAGGKGVSGLLDTIGVGRSGRADRVVDEKTLGALAKTKRDPLTGDRLPGGMTPDDAVRVMDEMRGAGALPALADLSDPLTRITAAAARVPGEAGDIAADFVTNRQAGQADRMASVFDDIFGGGGKTVARFVDDLSDHQKAVAGPLYRQAMQSQAKVDTTPLVIEIADELKDAVGTREANLKKVLGYLRREMMDGSAHLKDDIASLHQAKLGIDDLIEKAHTESGIGRSGKRVLVRLKEQLLDLMDGADSNYKAARAEWAGDAALKEAAEQGQDFLKMSPEEVARLWAPPKDGGLSKSQREAFKIGALDSIKTAINSAGDGRTKVLALFGSPQARARLEAILGPDDFKRLSTYMQSEKMGTKTNQKIVGGSITSERLADDQALGADVAVKALVSPGGVWRDVLRWAGGQARGMNSGTAADIVERMTQTDPEMAAKMLQALREAWVRQQNRNPLSTVAPYGIGLGGVAIPGDWLN